MSFASACRRSWCTWPVCCARSLDVLLRGTFLPVLLWFLFVFCLRFSLIDLGCVGNSGFQLASRPVRHGFVLEALLLYAFSVYAVLWVGGESILERLHASDIQFGQCQSQILCARRPRCAPFSQFMTHLFIVSPSCSVTTRSRSPSWWLGRRHRDLKTNSCTAQLEQDLLFIGR